MEMYEQEPVYASIGPKALGNVDRYFTNDLRTIIQETLQNCRRAGADTVTITRADDGSITIEDNGRGIDLADIQVLLSFGRSKNDAVTEADERAAGMGLFALSKRGCTVRSRDWRCSLTPEMFRGERPAVPVADRKGIVGTAIAFEGSKGHGEQSAYRTRAMITDVARRMPYRTTYNGATIPRMPTSAELIPIGGADTVRRMSRTVGDCTVTVARFEDARNRMRDGKAMRPRRATL